MVEDNAQPTTNIRKQGREANEARQQLCTAQFLFLFICYLLIVIFFTLFHYQRKV
jgi:hypothetical protein